MNGDITTMRKQSTQNKYDRQQATTTTVVHALYFGTDV